MLALSNPLRSEVMVSIPDTSATQGKTIEIPIRITGISVPDSIVAYQIKIEFDPAMVQTAGVSILETMTENWGDPTVNSSANWIRIGGFTTNQPGKRLVADKGNLIKLKLLVVGDPYHFSKLHLSYAQLFNLNGQVAIGRTDGSVLVNPDLRNPWRVDLTVSGGGQPFPLVFGEDVSGNYVFDVGLDVASTPVPPTYFAYFEIGALPNALSTDIRGLLSPSNSPIDWVLKVVNADGVNTTVTWNPLSLPSEGCLLITADASVNMRAASSIAFSGNKTVSIQHRYSTLGTPVFQSLQIVNSSNLKLSFTDVPGAVSYNVYRGTSAAFVPDKTNGTNRIGTEILDQDAGTSGIQWSDFDPVAGDPAMNHFYAVTAVGGIEESEPSSVFGAFGFSLVTTPTTDFNEIALPLVLAGVTNAQQLMAAIPNCNSVARWSASMQGYEQYIPGVPFTNFSVQMGYPYYVNVTSNTVFNLLGGLARPVFLLITTPTTDFNEVMLTLDRTGIAKSSQLMTGIPNCNSVARWNASMQGYEQYVPGLSFTDFSVRVGYPYYVNMTANTTWPAAGVPKPVFRESIADISGTGTRAPHTVWGRIRNLEENAQAGTLRLTAFIATRPEEKLSETSPGCFIKDGYWAIQCAAFGSNWKVGDILKIILEDRNNSIRIEREIALTYDPENEADALILKGTKITPAKYSLGQNYPNPFNAETTIEYQLPEETQVAITIYNNMGQEIRELMDGKKPAGSYKIVWDGLDGQGKTVTSGIYYLKMKSQRFAGTQKLLIMR